MLIQQQKKLEFNKFESLEEKFEYAKSMHLVAKFEEGLSYFRILKTEYEAIKRYDRVIDCLGWICQNLANLGRVEELYNYLPEYKSICKEHGTELNQLKLSTYLAFISTSIGDEKSAIEYYQEAIAIAKKLNDTKRYVISLINLQGVYLLIKDFEQANAIALEVKKQFVHEPSIKTTMSEAAYYLNLMTIQLEWQQLQTIEPLFHAFEAIANIEKYNREQMYYQCVKGRYYIQLQRYSDAITELENAYAFIVQTKEEPFLTIILENLVQAHEISGNYQEALYYAKKFNEKLLDQHKKHVTNETIKVIKEIDLDNMKQLVYIDGLTSIPNRRYLEKFGAKLIDEAAHNVHCAIIDIDHFKKINDRFGHIVGDLAIQQLAQIIQGVLPENFLFARYAGDEFVFLAKQLGKDAETILQQLFASITDFEFQTDDIYVKLTISMGVASLADCEVKELKTLLDLADQALYQSKNTGRNLISFYVNA
ncbi:GGDEF domain-containing protein [Solibacillus sp. MA9]|uniref:GGDEF domain-containing protein n=1 Tax=Solibacillus palustris TaxID=2908203 RepID=A0ABS9UBK3_9BACL|nr:GGDEF domain-containing protein [Solibacillus sp. MA9]MCH7321549.1 GGDEF domain-containing protein [Solibacillus sp. MA9]